MVTSAHQPTGNGEETIHVNGEEMTAFDLYSKQLAETMKNARITAEQRPLFEAACITVEAAFMQVFQIKEAVVFTRMISGISAQLEKLKKDERYVKQAERQLADEANKPKGRLAAA